MSNYKNPKGYSSVQIVYGNIAKMIPPEERESELSHKWEIYVKAPKNFIKSVTFKLHETFINPIVTIDREPFSLEQYGWGEFTIQIKAILFNNDRIFFSHFLKLYGSKPSVKSEKKETVFYKGDAVFDVPKECEITNDSEEFDKIEKAIDHTLEELNKLR